MIEGTSYLIPLIEGGAPNGMIGALKVAYGTISNTRFLEGGHISHFLTRYAVPAWYKVGTTGTPSQCTPGITSFATSDSIFSVPCDVVIPGVHCTEKNQKISI